MIRINNISKVYQNEQKVLNIPFLEIKSGESFGLVGNNGAGKTTLFSLMLDLIQPTTGSININDIQVDKSEAWKPYTTSYLDESFLIGYLTPEEYFYFLGDLRNQNSSDVNVLLDQYQDFFNGEVLNQKKYIRDFSKGNQKKIGIIGSLIGDPDIVILDEPFANLDPSTQIRLKKIIKELSELKGKTILVSSHDLLHTVDVSNRIVALYKGEIVKDVVKSENTLSELEVFFNV